VAAAAAELEALRPPPPPPPPVVERPQVDTLGPMNRLLAAEAAVAAAGQRLDEDRRVNAALTVRAEAAQQGVNFVAPPVAVLAAAVVLALVAGYLAVLVGELRTPRVADAPEVERETGRRVLAVVGPSAPAPERTRRRADERTPDALDPTADAYRLLYLHMSPTGASLPVVTVTGEEPAVVAIVAANLAAAAAEYARSTLLVDADLQHGLVAPALRTRPAPGVAELLRGDAGWPDAVTSAVFGRERVVDVVPAGLPMAAADEPLPDDAFRRDLLRLARRYDLTVLATPLAHAVKGSQSILPAPDVVLCVRAPDTTLVDLRVAVDALHGAGLRVQGVVLWDDDPPAVERYSGAEWRARAGSRE
jgi:Mrp family chromosome partitioning ATPase